MGLTITCVWRLLVLDTEAVLDGVPPPTLRPSPPCPRS